MNRHSKNVKMNESYHYFLSSKDIISILSFQFVNLFEFHFYLSYLQEMSLDIVSKNCRQR